MHENDDANRPASPSPEEEAELLLKSLELQRSAQLGRKLPEPVSGMAFRYFVLVLVVFGTIAAVAFLEWFASQIAKPRQPAGSSTPAGSSQVAPRWQLRESPENLRIIF